MLTLPDRKCVELATHFLPDDEGDRIWSLALAFQEVVEDFGLTECETVPVQKSGQATAEHGGGGADPILREVAAPTLGIEVELRRRWKEYRDHSVSPQFSNMEQMAFGGRAGGLLEAIKLIEAIPLSDTSTSTPNR